MSAHEELINHGYIHNSTSLIVAGAITWIAAIVFTGLRFWSKRISRTFLWWDDWLIIAALVVSQGKTAGGLWWIIEGSGIYSTSYAENLEHTLITVFFLELLFAIQLTLVRLSVLALYMRIFTTRGLRLYCHFWGSLALLWCLANIVFALIQCRPIRGFWDVSIQSSCNVSFKMFIVPAAWTGMIIDLGILAFPMVYCWRLKLGRTEKILLTAIFASGLFVTVITVARISAIDTAASQNGETYVFGSFGGVWTITEMDMAIVSACLPCLRPLIAKVVPRRWVPKSLQRKPVISPSPISSVKQQAICC